jgi:hypothetical protein
MSAELRELHPHRVAAVTRAHDIAGVRHAWRLLIAVVDFFFWLIPCKQETAAVQKVLPVTRITPAEIELEYPDGLPAR